MVEQAHSPLPECVKVLGARRYRRSFLYGALYLAIALVYWLIAASPKLSIGGAVLLALFLIIGAACIIDGVAAYILLNKDVYGDNALEAIEAAKDLLNKRFADQVPPEDLVMATSPAASIIPWIRVEDGLPELGRVVLIRYITEHSVYYSFGGRVDDVDGWLWGRVDWSHVVLPLSDGDGRFGNDIQTDDEYNVTHWAELTEPMV